MNEITMNIAESTYDIWKSTAKSQGKSMGEALRDFLALYKYLYDTQLGGERILIEHEREEIKELILN